jgi:hypothetical protein
MERHRRATVCFQAGHIRSRRGSCERYALPPVAFACRWSLVLLSPLLSAARTYWARGSTGDRRRGTGDRRRAASPAQRLSLARAGPATSSGMVYEMATSRPISI